MNQSTYKEEYLEPKETVDINNPVMLDLISRIIFVKN
jgi:hypothetical protein